MELSEATFLEGILENQDCAEYVKGKLYSFIFHLLMEFLIIFKIMAYKAW
jgi:hypothetical protein